MNSNVFKIDNFNVIKDDDYYYVFRALNNEDYIDLINGKNDRIRTDRERYEETIGKSEYNGSQISLVEVYDHVKMHHLKNTNCISLSSNANISIDYGKNYHEQYAMIKIPKNDFKNVYEVGKYMLDEVNKIVNNKLLELDGDSVEKNTIEEIDNVHNIDEISEILKKYIERLGTDKVKSVYDRFSKKQYFSNEQQLEYNKIIAKVTILELSGIKKSILKSTIDNSSLLATIGNAFSSSELIHYGDIGADNFVMVSPKMMSILALIQQAKEHNYTSNLIEIEQKIVSYVNEGYDIKDINGKLCLVNENNIIDLNLSIQDVSLFKDDNLNKDDLSIDRVYQITKGRVRYEKVVESLDFVYNLVKAKNRASDYSLIIRAIMDDDRYGVECDNIKTLYDIDDSIIDRQNNVGKKITEAVSIGMNKSGRRFFSNKEQKEIIQLIDDMDKEEQELLLSGQLNLNSLIIEKLLDKEQEISENEYYIEAIVEGLYFNKIYKNSLYPRVMTEDEKIKISNKLFVGDCKSLYNAFFAAGVSRIDIPNYIINLYLEKGYKGYSFEELSRLPDLFSIIRKNIGNLNYSILPIELDKMIEIEDNVNEVENTYINLRDYQFQTVNNIKSLYESGKRFAGVVLPTGAGKSFVAMTTMLDYSNGNIVYFAPNNEILRQIQRHIIRYIINYNKSNLEKEEALKDPQKYDLIIREKFPHLRLYCYQGLSNKEEEELERLDANLIILDELHRTGAETWNPKIRKLINRNSNAKILGLTATPVRDVDGKNMMLEMAKLTEDYSPRELLLEKYLAVNMNVLDAMKDGIVVSPNIVSFDYTLENSDEYKEVKRMYESEINLDKKEQLGEVYQEMKTIITNSKIKGLKGIINENIKKKDGKYIVFLPKNDDRSITAEQYMKNQIEVVKEYFKDIDMEPEIEYLISDREDKKENVRAIQKFESSKSNHLKLIFAVNMLNEGVHVDGIDGLVMLRPISENSTILYLQQLGRSIYSLDPENPINEDDIPVVFDIYNNYLVLDMDRKVNKTSIASDLERFKAVYLWIEKHKFIPDINSVDIEEAKRAKILKMIKVKYQKYLEKDFNVSFTEKEIYEINEILELGKKISLWNIEIPNRIISPDEKEIGHVDTFTAKGVQKKFLELANKSRRISGIKQQSLKMRMKICLSVLDVLVEYGYEINADTLKNNYILKDIISELPSYAIDVLNELGISEDYQIGLEYYELKKRFYGSRLNLFEELDLDTLIKFGLYESFTLDGKVYKLIDDYDFIIKGPMEFRGLNLETRSISDKDGFDINGINQYNFYRTKKHVQTGKFLTANGFNYLGINIETNTFLDKNNFDINGYFYRFENRQYVNTGRKVNDRNFDQDGYFYKFDELHNCYVNSYEKYDEYDRDVSGYDKRGFNVDKFHKNGTLFDENGFNAQGMAQRVNKVGEEILFPINKYGFDCHGIYYKMVDGKYVKTTSKVDENGFNVNGMFFVGGMFNNFRNYNSRFFDRDGFYYKKDSNSDKRIKTNRKFDENGFNLNGYAVITNENSEKKFSKINKYGFDCYGDWHDPNNSGKVSKRDLYGFDIKGIHFKTKTKFDMKNFDRDGFYYEDGIKTVRKYNNDYFDRNGYYWIISDNGERVKSNLVYDDEGYNFEGLNKKRFNRNGEYLNKKGCLYNKYGFDCKDIHVNTGLPYDEKMFLGGGVSKYQFENLISGFAYDIRGFDIDGDTVSPTVAYINGTLKLYDFYQDKRYLYTGKKRDGMGFDANGICVYTNSLYNQGGYNAYNVDINGKTPEGVMHPDIVFTQRYIKSLVKGTSILDDEEMNNYLESKLKELNNVVSKNRLITIIIYAAGEMYPSIKKDLDDAIKHLQNTIKAKKQELEKKKIKKEEVENLIVGIEKLQNSSNSSRSNISK